MRLCLCSEKTPTALFFKYNTQLGPPYQVLVDTNFINFSIKNKVYSLLPQFQPHLAQYSGSGGYWDLVHILAKLVV